MSHSKPGLQLSKPTRLSRDDRDMRRFEREFASAEAARRAKEPPSCCETFELAREPGTDNEGFLTAINWDGEKYGIGGIDAPLMFCPFCGAERGTHRRKR